MKNTIKRTTTKMIIRTKFDGTQPKNTIVELTKEYYGWVGGGYLWLVSMLRNGELIDIIEQY